MAKMVSSFLLLALFMGSYAVYAIAHAVWDLFLHPLHAIPGPRLWIIFPCLRQYANICGDLDAQMREFHCKYGEVVRFGPNEVSFITEQAWKDIYDHRPNQLERFILSETRRLDIFDANEADHDRYRKAMAPAFSPRGLIAQEPIITGYIDQFVNRLSEAASAKSAVDILKWYNLTTFDIIGDLAFGESFGGLENQEYHFTISFTFEAFKLLTYLEAGAAYPILLRLLMLFTPKRLIDARDRKEEHAEETVQKRLRNGSLHGRGDFMDAMLRHRGEKQGLNDRELIANASTLITAGSETTATTLSGITYWLLKTPSAMLKVVREVREAFATEADMSFNATATQLPYMVACIEEGLRLYPPVPTGLQRVTPPDGMTRVSGIDIPPNTKVSVHQSAAFMHPDNFHNPGHFAPERWLAKSEPSSPYYHDRREILQPFSVGPRSCPGRNLAYHEIRLILARILWRFDLDMASESEHWNVQKSFFLWEKKPLMIGLKERI